MIFKLQNVNENTILNFRYDCRYESFKDYAANDIQTTKH